MSLEPKLRSLIQRMIETERFGRENPFRETLARAQAEAAEHGRLGAGWYATAQERRCGDELESRATQWLAVAVRSVEESQTPWTDALAAEVKSLLRQELAKDWDGLFDRLRTVLRPHGHDRLSGHLDGSQTRSYDRIDQELELRVLRQDKSRIPLSEQLSAPRYEAVSASWSKANGYLNGPAVDLENAAKEAVGAVEGLARLIISEPHTTLGDAIKALRSRRIVSPPMLRGLEELWGYTSNTANVRHGGGAGSPISLAETRYVVDLAAAALRLLLQIDAA